MISLVKNPDKWRGNGWLLSLMSPLIASMQENWQESAGPALTGSKTYQDSAGESVQDQRPGTTTLFAALESIPML